MIDAEHWNSQDFVGFGDQRWWQASSFATEGEDDVFRVVAFGVKATRRVVFLYRPKGTAFDGFEKAIDIWHDTDAFEPVHAHGSLFVVGLFSDDKDFAN